MPRDTAAALLARAYGRGPDGAQVAVLQATLAEHRPLAAATAVALGRAVRYAGAGMGVHEGLAVVADAAQAITQARGVQFCSPGDPDGDPIPVATLVSFANAVLTWAVDLDADDRTVGYLVAALADAPDDHVPIVCDLLAELVVSLAHVNGVAPDDLLGFVAPDDEDTP